MKLPRNQVLMLGVLVLGTFITVLNQTVVSPALPSIMRETGVETATAQWLTTGFTLVNAIMIPITAYLTDRFSTRVLFLVSMTLFTAGSLLAGWSSQFPLLLAGRLVQAAGAGILIPMVMTVLVLTFPTGKRGTALGVFSLVVAFAPAIGPTAAGLIIDHASWHVMFYLIAGLSAAVLAAAAIILKKEKPTSSNSATLDPPSIALSTLGFGSLLFGFSDIGRSGAEAPAFIGIGVGLIALAVFTHRQLTMERPMLDVRVLKSRRFLTSTIIGMVVQASLLAAGILMPIYLQTLHGYSAVISGLVMLPGAIVMGAMGPVAGRLVDKHGPRALSIVGMLGLTISSAALAFLTMHTSLAVITILYLVRMFSLALVNMPVTTWGINSLDDKLINHATAINNTLRQVAGSLGTAVVVSISAIASSVGIHHLNLGEQAASLFGINVAFAACALLCAVGSVLAIAFVRGRAGEEADTQQSHTLPKLRSIMRQNVPFIREDASVADALALMEGSGARGLPVVDKSGKATGFVSDGDIMRALAPHIGEHFVDPVVLIMHAAHDESDFERKITRLMGMQVSEIGTAGIIGVNVNANLPEVCRVLGKNHLEHAPVLEGERIVGVINRSDITKAIAQASRRSLPQSVN